MLKVTLVALMLVASIIALNGEPIKEDANDPGVGPLTTGGNGKGKRCVFPFKYHGKKYSRCIKAHHNKAWCGTTANYDHDKQWGNCVAGPPTHGGNAKGSPCAFPFVYRGKKYSGCTKHGFNKLWCATTHSYDHDKKWGYCPKPVPHTTGGNSKGAQCVFPFIYRGKKYSGCTKVAFHHLWCATTNNYDHDKKWGYCAKAKHDEETIEDESEGPAVDDGEDVANEIKEEPVMDESEEVANDPGAGPLTTGGNGKGKRCVFPFKYHGKKYSRCIKAHHNKAWCGTTANYDHDKQWGNCVAGPPTHGGNAKGAACAFPFVYRGKKYSGCTKHGFNKRWCATTHSYDHDKKWGYCPKPVPHTTGGNSKGAHCVFPFIYRGKKYSGCTKVAFHHLWCATTNNYDHDKKWGYCAKAKHDEEMIADETEEPATDDVEDESEETEEEEPIEEDVEEEEPVDEETEFDEEN